MDFMGVPIFFSLVKHISQTLMEEVMSTFTLSRNGKYATQKWGRRVYGGTILKESGKLYTLTNMGGLLFLVLFSLHKQGCKLCIILCKFYA
jgi:hypothetical protein